MSSSPCLKTCAAVLVVAFSLAPVWARKTKPAKSIPMTQEEMILHAANRLTFGPRPGDLQAIRQIGLKKWIEQQLHPDSIPENPILTAKLAPLDTLGMSPIEMARKYPPNILIKQMMDGKVPWPSDPDTRVIIQRLADRYRAKAAANANATDTSANDSAAAKQGAGKRSAEDKAVAFDDAIRSLSPSQKQAFQQGRPEEKLRVLQSLPLGQQVDLVIAMPAPTRAKVFAVAAPDYRRRMETFGGPQRLVNQDLVDSKIYRAVFSNRQLEEVLTDFWYNHFNVNADKGGDRYLVTSYERDAIRPYVLGKFKDLLLATAQSPAMLFYLDNYQSVGPNAKVNPYAKRAKNGLNENYGRELMELHTLGVDGGYTQQDVTEVARCFTGWSIDQPRRGAAFRFNEKQHDAGEKHVLGHTIPAGGGIEDGYKVIDILVHHPSTARFISRSLAIRFVSDNPPQSLVERMAATFTKTDGDLRRVLEAMLKSPEFWSRDEYRAKIKSPFEMVVSALRATGADLEFTQTIANQLNQLGEPLYRKQEPTGYSNKSAEWMNSAALLGRMNFALNLTAGKIAGAKLPPIADTDLDTVARRLIGVPLTADSRQIVEKGLAAPDPVQAANAPPASDTPVHPIEYHAPTPALVAGLTLGSPDFQRR